MASVVREPQISPLHFAPVEMTIYVTYFRLRTLERFFLKGFTWVQGVSQKTRASSLYPLCFSMKNSAEQTGIE
jgi:hypothetical protein